MRTISAKTLYVLFGLLVPSLGSATPAEAGVIPWLYNSIFGHGWGNNYSGGSGYNGGYGYGGGMASSAGCCGSSYGGGYSAPVYSAPVYSAPAMSAPVAPTGETYQSLYGPTLGDYGYGYGYDSAYVVDSGSCCTPCSACTTGDCATSIESAKPAPNPTPADNTVPVTPKNKVPPTDQFGPSKSGTGVGGTGRTGVGVPTDDEALPDTERRPNRKPLNESVEPLVPPAEAVPPVDDAPPSGTLMQVVPSNHHIAVRYVPAPRRMVVAIPRSTARVVRIDRATREQLSRVEPKPQLASNP